MIHPDMKRVKELLDKPTLSTDEQAEFDRYLSFEIGATIIVKRDNDGNKIEEAVDTAELDRKEDWINREIERIEETREHEQDRARREVLLRDIERLRDALRSIEKIRYMDAEQRRKQISAKAETLDKVRRKGTEKTREAARIRHEEIRRVYRDSMEKHGTDKRCRHVQNTVKHFQGTRKRPRRGYGTTTIEEVTRGL